MRIMRALLGGTPVLVGSVGDAPWLRLDDVTANMTGAPRRSLSIQDLLRCDPPTIAALSAACRNSPESAAVPTEEITTYLPPVPDPPRIFCVGRNYAEHAVERGAEVPSTPMIFLKPATAMVGHAQEVIIPSSTTHVDWEGEFAVVIGGNGRDIEPDSALDLVAGYTIANDVSARDWQYRTTQFDIGKMFDTFCPIGPWLVTPDEITDIGACSIETIVTGEVMQSASLSDMVFPVADLISYLSRVTRLRTGDIILTGTPSGVGYARQPQRFLTDGDSVTVKVSGIGELRSPVISSTTAASRGYEFWGPVSPE